MFLASLLQMQKLDRNTSVTQKFCQGIPKVNYLISTRKKSSVKIQTQNCTPKTISQSYSL